VNDATGTHKFLAIGILTLTDRVGRRGGSKENHRCGHLESPRLRVGLGGGGSKENHRCGHLESPRLRMGLGGGGSKENHRCGHLESPRLRVGLGGGG
jgi:hypothetical protein